MLPLLLVVELIDWLAFEMETMEFTFWDFAGVSW